MTEATRKLNQSLALSTKLVWAKYYRLAIKQAVYPKQKQRYHIALYNCESFIAKQEALGVQTIEDLADQENPAYREFIILIYSDILNCWQLQLNMQFPKDEYWDFERRQLQEDLIGLITLPKLS